MIVAFVLLAVGLTMHAVALARDFRRKRQAERRLLDVVTNGWAPAAPVGFAEALKEGWREYETSDLYDYAQLTPEQYRVVVDLDEAFYSPAYGERS